MQRLRLEIARADLAQSVREQFARAVAARERLDQANETVERVPSMRAWVTISVRRSKASRLLCS